MKEISLPLYTLLFFLVLVTTGYFVLNENEDTLLGLAPSSPQLSDFANATNAYKKKDYETAYRGLLSLAEAGDAQAQYWLGRIYEDDYLWSRNSQFSIKLEEYEKREENKTNWYKAAFENFTLLAQKNDPVAQYHLGAMLRRARGIDRDYNGATEKDREEAAKWHKLAYEKFVELAKKDDADAQYWLGRIYYYGDEHFLQSVKSDTKEALKWFTLAANQGHLNAQYWVGYMHYNGWGVDERNYAEAIKWFKTAANQGDHQSQNKLGDIYYVGAEVEQDTKEAVKWYSLAAKQGDVESQYQLGNIYYNGLGIRQDYEEALKWYTLAAEKDHKEAQDKLTHMYYEGLGVDKEKKEAFK